MTMGRYKILECDMRVAPLSDTTQPQEVIHPSTPDTCLSMLVQGLTISINAHIVMKSVDSTAPIPFLHHLYTPQQTSGLAHSLMDI